MTATARGSRGTLRRVGSVDEDQGRLTPVDLPLSDAAAAKLGLEAMRRLADDQTKRIETARASFRQIFIYNSVFFAAAQTVAAGALKDASPTRTEATWVIGLAMAAVGLLGVLAYFVLRMESLSRVRAIAPRDIVRAVDNPEKVLSGVRADEVETDPEFYVLAALTKLERDTVEQRTALLKAKTKRSAWVTVCAITCFALLCAEVGFSLVLRIPS